MRFFLRFGNLITLGLIIILAFVSFKKIGYLPSKNLLSKNSNTEVITSNVDMDNDGIDDYTDILNGAKKFVAMKPKYKDAYYSGGYPTDGYYVCTDLLWFSLKEAGYDFKSMIDQDIKKNIQDYDIEAPDSNIDFRRVRNIKVFLDKYTDNLTTDGNEISEFQPGDIIIYDKHIAIVSDKRNEEGVSYIIHHDGYHNYEDDGLMREKIIGHYRFNLNLED